MEVQLHRNFKISSYLIFAAGIIDFINGTISYYDNSSVNLTSVAETSLLFITMGYFAMLGKHWIKWVLLFITILSGFPLISLLQKESSVTAFFSLSLLTLLLKLIACLLLFLIPVKRNKIM